MHLKGIEWIEKKTCTTVKGPTNAHVASKRKGGGSKVEESFIKI